MDLEHVNFVSNLEEEESNNVSFNRYDTGTAR